MQLMKVKVIVFGVAKDIIGGNELELEVGEPNNVAQLKQQLKKQFPGLPDCMIAVNAKYANDEQVIKPKDEVALIPPTNGG